MDTIEVDGTIYVRVSSLAKESQDLAQRSGRGGFRPDEIQQLVINAGDVVLKRHREEKAQGSSRELRMGDYGDKRTVRYCSHF